MEFYIYWEPERWISEREKNAEKLTGLSMFKPEIEILVVYANDCDWRLCSVLVRNQTASPASLRLSCVDWCWYMCEYCVISPKMVNTAPNSRKQLPSPPLVCEHNSNMTHRARRKKKEPDWELNPGPLPNFIFILRKDHTARPSGLINLLFGFIYF